MDRLSELRNMGWMVAVHNDYKIRGVFMTFWLLTHDDGSYVRGEGPTDKAALQSCAEEIEAKARRRE